MTIRNIDVVNSLTAVCEQINVLKSGDECGCPICRSQSSGHPQDNSEFAPAMAVELRKVKILLEQLTPKYIARFDDYEIDYSDMMQAICNALISERNLHSNLDIVLEHINQLWELCDAEVKHYLFMTHPTNHNDLVHIEISFEEDDCHRRGKICRALVGTAGA